MHSSGGGGSWKIVEPDNLGSTADPLTAVQELGGRSGVQPGARRVQLLEVSQYLENYLWPNFDAGASSWEHTMSILMMINEKFREGMGAWAGLRGDAAKFESFFRRFLHFKVQRRAVCWSPGLRMHCLKGWQASF